MASVIPFNNATIGVVDITTAEMVHGSCKYTITGIDESTPTADGRIHWVRKAITREINFTCFGDKTALESALGLGAAVEILYDSTSVFSGTGICTTTYNSSNKTTSVKVAVDPV